MNFFDHLADARRYAAARPYFHPLVAERIRAWLGTDTPVRLAVDVGCGTGQSARALLPLADRVVGIDRSPAMLTQIGADPWLAAVAAPAEALPLADASADLVTASLAFHWFDRQGFLGEVRRVLRPGGWLVIYNNVFRGHMIENEAFARWFRSVYLDRYPSPPRHSGPLTEDDAARFGLRWAGREDYDNLVVFRREELARYFITQTNIIVALDAGATTAEAVFDWLDQELQPLFPSEPATFRFGGDIWFLQRSEL